ncbi:histidinol dehydrogenase [Desulfosarcina alkanivorans]|jgi:sulfopropanediol 3-dehydrogenase|uniref:Histidinol dehydrogenase n=1 Tax=Desulfosarcina alkanivorans TaxID=571177 RepID=A0A5K7YM20_9BACT|nr:histidinol dehydrogenase [Desulfosarcina alkanivorans]BBO67891.1 histidinol dehydrogenase [Desulfosarcina alkanivorans]
MSSYLKKAAKTPETDERETQEIVEGILKDVRENGEEAFRRHYGAKFENWSGKLILSPEEIETQGAAIPDQLKEDLTFAYDQVYGFAVQQRESMKEFETEIYPGVTLGQRLIPCNCAGCYIPGGRFAHAASAIMSIATAKAAGVPFVTAISPSHDGLTINPAILYAVSLCKPDVFMMMGGAHAIAALAYGHFTGHPADVIVGPGNRFVAEAKRILFGQIGIDVFAGPTESLILADRTADPYIVAMDLMSQAEHGYDSPVWLVTDSKTVGQAVLEWMPKVIGDLPNPEVAEAAWRDYGEVVLCADREEMAEVNDVYAAEHVQVIAEDLDWWVNNLTNYGSLFLGEACTVPYGDKTSGTNHILPTKKAARYSGGLSVGKFIKTVTYQKLTEAANLKIGAVASRISRIEGMEGHARAADVRLRKYFPDESFDFEVYTPPAN